MSADVFLDTNILVYGLAQNDARSRLALALLRAGGIISVQVLNEFTNVARRRLSRSWTEVAAALEAVAVLLPRVMPITIETHRLAISLARQERVAFYDALIIASALEANCSVLLTEDLQHARIIRRRLTIRNPFAGA